MLHEDESWQLVVVPDAVLNSKEMHPFPAMARHRAAHCANELPEEVPCSLALVQPADPVTNQVSAALTTEGNSASNRQTTAGRHRKRNAERRLVVQRAAIMIMREDSEEFSKFPQRRARFHRACIDNESSRGPSGLRSR